MLPRISIEAFALSPDVTEALTGARDERALGKARLEVMEGGLDGAIARYATQPSAQVILVEEAEGQALAERLDVLAERCEPGTKLIVIGATNDITLYRQLIAGGVSEYLLKPVTPRQIADCLANLFADPAAQPKGKVVAFWGARGGAGCSTLAQNMAWALGRGQAEAAIYVDLDVVFGSSLLAFNLEARQSVAEILAAPERLDAMLLERFLVAHDDKLKVLASAADPRQSPAITVDGVERLLDLAARMAPVVVVDLPHLWADWSEHILASADELVLVSEPNLASLRDTKTLLEVLATRRAGAAVRLVLNKLDAYKKTQLTPKDFEETLGLKPALLVPFEPVSFGEAANNGQMLAEAAKGSKVNEALAALAQQIMGKKAAVKPRPGLFDWMMRK